MVNVKNYLGGTSMSRTNFGAKPIMLPQPVLIIATYDKNGVPDAMNAAWGITTDFKEITISLSEHKTTDNLADRGAFTVSMGTVDQVDACDYVGIESARKVPDKFARAGFHATKSEFVDAPLIDELPMALECKVKSFKDGILIGEIVNVSADNSVITNGQIDLDKLRPIAFDPCNNKYVALGEAVGDAFLCGNKLKQ
jgi:flavin reductase (DIM6/NTAB) family NADH-FMN oxidoreductase RutF